MYMWSSREQKEMSSSAGRTTNLLLSNRNISLVYNKKNM